MMEKDHQGLPVQIVNTFQKCGKVQLRTNRLRKMEPSRPVGSAGLFSINCLETDSRASLFRNFPAGYLQ